MELFLKHKTVILRTVGGLMLVVGFAVHFWTTPKEGFSKAELAAANVARMEAKIKGGSSQSSKAGKKDNSKYLDEFKSTKEKQMRYLTIIAMILGIGFVGYTFIKKDEPTA